MFVDRDSIIWHAVQTYELAVSLTERESPITILHFLEVHLIDFNNLEKSGEVNGVAAAIQALKLELAML
ncbi:MAG: hypothetical protein H7A36_06010 [Chlamydiales bacterium]|nr:hypothetical protein [Chlamydiales bacterium]